ncbi:MAG: zf-TFIIB domain-containing protein [Candidatus Thermoplasmatota archaeon]|nr:zf-TFIIB domain-containing protein [Candidatus Thermoplasmatota archaeon]
MMPLSCPRDGSILMLPEDSERSTFSRHGIHHCNECSGMLLNAEAAASTMSEQKLNKMHDSFESGGTEVNLDCPLCDSHMRVRKIVFSRIDGTQMEPIEIDGCPACSSFWFDAGELQRISPPVVEYDAHREANALSIVMEMLMHLPFVII